MSKILLICTQTGDQHQFTFDDKDNEAALLATRQAIGEFLANGRNPRRQVHFRLEAGELSNLARDHLYDCIVDSRITHLMITGFSFPLADQLNIDETISDNRAERAAEEQRAREIAERYEREQAIINARIRAQVQRRELAAENFESRLKVVPRLAGVTGVVVYLFLNGTIPFLGFLPIAGYFVTKKLMQARHDRMLEQPFNQDQRWDNNEFPAQLQPQERNAMLAGIDAQRSMLMHFRSVVNKDAWNLSAFDQGWEMSETNDRAKLGRLGR